MDADEKARIKKLYDCEDSITSYMIDSGARVAAARKKDVKNDPRCLLSEDSA